MSFMTQAELFTWPKLNRWGAQREKSLRQCISDYVVLYPDEKTCEVLSKIKVVSRLAGRPISEADAWIAATAIRYRLPLITRNHRDFNFIDDLELIPVSDLPQNS